MTIRRPPDIPRRWPQSLMDNLSDCLQEIFDKYNIPESNIPVDWHDLTGEALYNYSWRNENNEKIIISQVPLEYDHRRISYSNIFNDILKIKSIIEKRINHKIDIKLSSTYIIIKPIKEEYPIEVETPSRFRRYLKKFRLVESKNSEMIVTSKEFDNKLSKFNDEPFTISEINKIKKCLKGGILGHTIIGNSLWWNSIKELEKNHNITPTWKKIGCEMIVGSTINEEFTILKLEDEWFLVTEKIRKRYQASHIKRSGWAIGSSNPYELKYYIVDGFDQLLEFLASID